MEIPAFVRENVNLAHARLGTQVVYVTDEFFAPRERMLKTEDPVFIPGKYDTHGKWMDGWESRRKREGPNDYCIVRLGLAGVIHGVEIDTRHFTGNYPPQASLEAIAATSLPTPLEHPGFATEHGDSPWHEILPRQPLRGDTRQFFAVQDPTVYTHVRLHIFPDGGIARLRIYGRPHVEWQQTMGLIDLAAMSSGGHPLAWNDAHFGAPQNVLAPGRGENMGDGWETRRRRDPGHDWLVIALGCPGRIAQAVIDTRHFKGNSPRSASLQAIQAHSSLPAETLEAESEAWPLLLPEQMLKAHCEHVFPMRALLQENPVNYVRLNIFPDGGISRLRLFGYPSLDS